VAPKSGQSSFQETAKVEASGHGGPPTLEALQVRSMRTARLRAEVGAAVEGEMTMPARFIVGGLLTALLLLGGCSMFSSAVQAPPPPPPAPVETISPQPGATYVWIPGAYTWQAPTRTYVWVPGHWTVPPKDYVWVPGHWETQANGTVWVDGQWRHN
jgi:WXXGXW repeat (2 copies)